MPYFAPATLHSPKDIRPLAVPESDRQRAGLAVNGALQAAATAAMDIPKIGRPINERGPAAPF
jgi:hypothetical protein